jgi:hypothetical protein
MGREIMYILAVVIFVISVISTFILGSSLSNYFDALTFIILITMFLPMMYSSGLLKSFFQSFSIMTSKNKTFSLSELKKTYNAVVLAIKLILVSGIALTCIGAIGLFSNIDDPKLILPSLSIAFLAVLYTFFIIIIFLPIQYRIKYLIEEQSDK